jgi:hypothetical protein
MCACMHIHMSMLQLHMPMPMYVYVHIHLPMPTHVYAYTFMGIDMCVILCMDLFHAYECVGLFVSFYVCMCLHALVDVKCMCMYECECTPAHAFMYIVSCIFCTNCD